ncbi:histidinol-phosphate phosphatase family protein (plasmid) [Peptoclostridium acidaminophilum DSM 3953]|uniref:D,D-heptose 1,7-bisphosphate phosphatase n=1 Tax=Peptoclostridium acidaminophilum DSM 3953 TaxID=1286171 RepID=W8TBQ8_PEPAC|nr:HAD-IIIA family hydrolase [Peptoclostridium acidaminophilum]AHM58265.1 histidinol-phosphate phosphatase family protein [Peptoclostridium acidaminophilum DSM 3953]
MKIAFMDRDGTIVKSYPDEEWQNVREPEILEGAIETMQEIIKRGYSIIILTNQYLLGEPEYNYTQVDYDEYTAKFLEILGKEGVQVKDIFYCPHGRHEGCGCIKPKPGMIKDALSKYPEINMKESFLVGDSVNDMKLAESFNLRSFGINVDYEDSVKIEGIKELLEYV